MQFPTCSRARLSVRAARKRIDWRSGSSTIVLRPVHPRSASLPPCKIVNSGKGPLPPPPRTCRLHLYTRVRAHAAIRLIMRTRCRTYCPLQFEGFIGQELGVVWQLLGMRSCGNVVEVRVALWGC